MKKYNRSTARQHVNNTIPRKVTKQSQMDVLKNKKLDISQKEIDERLKDILVSISGTAVEPFVINQVNMFRDKLSKNIYKEQQRISGAKRASY